MLVADGGTDLALTSILDWAIHRLDPAVEILEPEFRKRQGSVQESLATLETGAMLVFVHRDGETATIQQRLKEFDAVVREDVVPVVPIRMTEAWLLISADAIAMAADHPGADITLPAIGQLESIANPKDRLEGLLMQAAGNPTGRRRKQFLKSIAERRVNVASLIDDFSPLESLPGFERFQANLRARYPYRHLLEAQGL